MFALPGVSAARAAGHSSSMMSMIRITKRSCFTPSPPSLSFDSSIHVRREKSRRILPLTGKCAQNFPRCESPRIGGFLHIGLLSPRAVSALCLHVERRHELRILQLRLLPPLRDHPVSMLFCWPRPAPPVCPLPSHPARRNSSKYHKHCRLRRSVPP